MRRNVLITGASSGLGAELARQYGARGLPVAICARRTGLLEDLRHEILTDEPRAEVMVRTLDVDDHDEVFTTFRELDDILPGGLDRVIVNAGLSEGQPVGTGRFEVNRATATTNLVSALAQCEAALELFRARQSGHLVVIGSAAGFRGLRRHGATYAASKAALVTLAEGLYAELRRTPVRITAINPGPIRTTALTPAGRNFFPTDITSGVRAMVRAIDREPASATVPFWPWGPLGWLRRYGPLSIASRLT